MNSRERKKENEYERTKEYKSDYEKGRGRELLLIMNSKRQMRKRNTEKVTNIIK